MSKSDQKQQKFKLVWDLGQQMIKILQKLHSTGYVHGDIKPENILFHDMQVASDCCPLENSYKYTLIDYGISQKYLDSDNMHIPKSKKTKFSGNIKFAAVECLEKYSKSPYI